MGLTLGDFPPEQPSVAPNAVDEFRPNLAAVDTTDMFGVGPSHTAREVNMPSDSRQALLRAVQNGWVAREVARRVNGNTTIPEAFRSLRPTEPRSVLPMGGK